MEAIANSLTLQVLSALGTLVLLGITALGLYALIMSPKWKREKEQLEDQLADEISNTPCPFCGVIFGSEAVEAARQERADENKETYENIKEKSHLGMFVSVSSNWNVLCHSCGKVSSYEPTLERSKRLSANQLCPSCGQPYGLIAVEEAHMKRNKLIREAIDVGMSTGEYNLDDIPPLHINCPTCGSISA